MDNFKIWSILVSNEENYDQLITQVANLADEFLPKSLHFILMDQKEELPKELLADLPDLIETEASERFKSFKKLVNSKLHPDHAVEVRQLHNARIGQVLKAIADQKTELLIQSRSSVSGISNLKYKVTRKTGASVLLLSDQDQLKWDSVLLPVDFSIYSNLATKLAKGIQLQRQMIPELNFVHAYQDGSRYLNQVFETAHEVQTALKQTTLVNEKLKRYAVNKMSQYLETHFDQIQSNEVIAHGRDRTVTELLIEKIEKVNPDLLLIGSKGDGKSIASLMGNTSDELIKQKGAQSILVAKQKGENKGFLKSFLP